MVMMIFLAALDEFSQVARVLGVADRGTHLGELLDRVADLLIEDAPVSDDDDRIEDRSLVLAKADELVGEPGDRVGLAAAGRVLDQITLTRAVPSGVGEQLPNHIELMEARPNLHRLLLAGLFVLGFDDLGVVFQDVGQTVHG